MSDESAVRLHISPLSPGLLLSYLTPEQQTLACDISYHSIKTFPEKAFGYVTLPAMEAHRVKKKFNGATLKGSRVRVQEANPEKRKVEPEEPSEESSGKKRRKKAAEHGVLPGFELPADRTVKRGWTDPDARPATRSRKAKKEKDDEKPKQQPSKYTKQQELIFRTKLPPTADVPKSKKKKSKRETAADLVVHEFENTQQFPAFLKTTHVDRKSKISRRFVEGEGWLDEDGNCVEEVNPSLKRRKSSPKPDDRPADAPTKAKKKDKRKESPSKDVLIEPEAAESNDIKSDGNSPAAPEAKPKRTSSRKSKPPALELKPQQDDHSPEAEEPAAQDASETKDSNPTPHPLEALYKRPKAEGASAVANEPFTFFDGKEADEAPQDLAVEVPHFGTQTPKSRGEPRWNRSGAPTPDTAYGRRRFSFSRGVVDDKVDEEDEDEDEEEVERATKGEEAAEDGASDAGSDAEGDGEAEKPQEESAWSKWFWENRGHNNRAWKKRRREALREVRKRENKRLSKRIL